MIQEARCSPSGVDGILRSGIMLGRAVTTTV